MADAPRRVETGDAETAMLPFTVFRFARGAATREKLQRSYSLSNGRPEGAACIARFYSCTADCFLEPYFGALFSSVVLERHSCRESVCILNIVSHSLGQCVTHSIAGHCSASFPLSHDARSLFYTFVCLFKTLRHGH